MKRRFGYLTALWIFSFCFFACHDLEISQQEEIENLEDGYGILRLNFGSDNIAKALIMPSPFASGDKISLTAAADGEETVVVEAEVTGTTVAISTKLKLNKKYTVTVDVLKPYKNDSNENFFTKYLSGTTEVTLTSAVSDSTVYLYNATPDSNSSVNGKISLRLSFNNNAVYKVCVGDGEHQCENYSPTNSGFVTYSCKPGKYKLSIQVLYTDNSVTDFTTIPACFYDIYIYPGLTTCMWIDSGKNLKVDMSESDIAYGENYMSGTTAGISNELFNSTDLNEIILTSGSSDELELQSAAEDTLENVAPIFPESSCTLTLLQGSKGQKITAKYDGEKLTPSATFDSNTKLTSYVFSFTAEEDKILSFTVKSLSGTQEVTKTINLKFAPAEYAQAVKDTESIACALGWSKFQEFTSGNKDFVPKKEQTYTIYTKEEYAQLVCSVSKKNYFDNNTILLKQDIDFKEKEMVSIGDQNNSFNGRFDGENHTLKNFKIKSDYAGVFANLGGEAVVKNLRANGGSIQGTSYAGGIAGCINGTSQVQNCFFSGTVTAAVCGGIAGYVSQGSTVSYCVAAGTVIEASGQELGGIAGRLSGKINNCVNFAVVDGNGGKHAAGIACLTRADSGAPPVIVACANFGTVKNAALSTGLVLTNSGTGTSYNNPSTISFSYNAGLVKDKSGKESMYYALTESLLENTYTLTNCYYLEGHNPAFEEYDPESNTNTVNSIYSFTYACGGGYNLTDFITAIDIDGKLGFINANDKANYRYESLGIVYPLPVSIEELDI